MMGKNNAVGSIIGVLILLGLGYWAYTLYSGLNPKSNNPVSTPAAKKTNIANQSLADALGLSPNPSLPMLAPQWTLADAAQDKLATADPDRPLIVRQTTDAGSDKWSRADGNFV